MSLCVFVWLGVGRATTLSTHGRSTASPTSRQATNPLTLPSFSSSHTHIWWPLYVCAAKSHPAESRAKPLVSTPAAAAPADEARRIWPGL